MNGMDGHLRDLLQAAVGEPPHRVRAEVVRRRVVRRRAAEVAAAAVAVAAIAVMISASVGALGRALGRGPEPAKPGPAPAATKFTSREYGYTEALPPGWRSDGPARQRWDGKGAPAATDPWVDLFIGPGGVLADVYAAPTSKSLAAYTAATIRAAHAGHPCPAVPQSDQTITIAGAPARLFTTQCPARTHYLVEIAVTVHHGTAFVFVSQNPSGNAPADQPADRAAFHKFLAGIRFPP